MDKKILVDLLDWLEFNYGGESNTEKVDSFLNAASVTEEEINICRLCGSDIEEGRICLGCEYGADR